MPIPDAKDDWSFGKYNTAKVVQTLSERPPTPFGLSQPMFKGEAVTTANPSVSLHPSNSALCNRQYSVSSRNVS